MTKKITNKGALIAIGTGIIFFLYLTKHKKTTKKMTGNFFNDLVAFIKNKEGGLSNNPNDPAAKNPSPTPQNYHTNKGITYKTFQDSAATFNYNPSLSNFLAMPDEIWKPIFINKYYNKAKLTNNEVLNGLFAYWYWQGWDSRYLPIKDVTQVINSNLSNKDKLKALTNLRLRYYRNIIAANPKLSIFAKGWNNTANDYYNLFVQYL